jgi:hypothetical protein
MHLRQPAPKANPQSQRRGGYAQMPPLGAVRKNEKRTNQGLVNRLPETLHPEPARFG